MAKAVAVPTADVSTGQTEQLRHINAERDPVRHKRFQADSLLTACDKDAFIRQETRFALLSVFVAIGILSYTYAFPGYFGQLSGKFLSVLAISSCVKIIYIGWLRRGAFKYSEQLVIALSCFSISIDLCTALGMAILKDAQDTPVSAVLVVPVLLSAVRLSFPSTICVIAAASAIDFYGYWRYFAAGNAVDVAEYFEVGTTAFTFVVAGTIVWIAKDTLLHKDRKLQESIADLTVTRDKLQKEERLAVIGRLSAAIAHEIRNPVAMISSSLALARTTNDDSSREGMFEIARKEAGRLERLTNDFLEYARPRTPVLQPCSVSDCLHYVRNVIYARAAERSIEVKISSKPDIIAYADCSQMHQALINIVLNAVEASVDSASVELSSIVDVAADEVVLQVSNGNGPIAERVVEHLFEPFFTTKTRGTGLGLAIAHNIITSNGGSLALTENSSACVCFTVRLPAWRREGSKQ